MFGGGEHEGIAAQGQISQGPGQQALVLGATRFGIDQQQIQVAAHAGVTAAVAAEHAHPLQAGMLHRHPFGPTGNLLKHQLRLRPAQQ